MQITIFGAGAQSEFSLRMVKIYEILMNGTAEIGLLECCVSSYFTLILLFY